MFFNIKYDLPASLVVFLVALPLCLGVALSSGAPLLSGIISGVIGGIVVGLLSKSQSSVSGPAAGLVALVVSAINQLGSFEIFLLAVVIAGFLQILASVIRAGIVANYIPSSVIKGLLAAIGIILILKQIPHAVGFDINPEDDFSFLQKDGENTFSELLNTLKNFSWGAILISLTSIIGLVFLEKISNEKFKLLPPSLLVVFWGVMVNLGFLHFAPQFYLTSKHLVAIPNIDSITSVITFPNFNAILNYKVWFIALSIAIFASLESLLNLDAIEKIDPHKRRSSPNNELFAQGVGNIICGLIGGIPITGVIVRSSVNIYAGAKSNISTILHGIFLLVSILCLVPFINLIPLSSLAVILLATGYKLTKISLFKEIHKKGNSQFIPFVSTVIAIVFTDLLIGVLIGLSISILFILKNNYKNPFLIETENLNIGETVRLELPNQVSFLNKASIKDTLWSVPSGSKLIIDATYCNYIDADILEIISEFKDPVAIERSIQLNILGIKEHYELVDQVQFVNILDREAQQKLTPDDVLDILKRGNERFTKGKWSEKYFKHQVNATAYGQNPFAVVLSCIDSRTSPEIIFDTGLGDVISIRIAGNIVTKGVLGSMELSCEKIGTKLIVVLGHSNCGAVSSAIYSLKDGNIAYITNKIDKAINDSNFERAKNDVSSSHMFDHIVKKNVKNSVEEILLNSEIIAKRIQNQEIKIVSAFYDTSSGIVHFD